MAVETTSDLDVRRRRAGYRAAHRGTKEMDFLLGRFAAARMEGMAAADLALFEALLDEPDPVLHQWIMDVAAIPDDRYAGLIRQLRAFHTLTPAIKA